MKIKQLGIKGYRSLKEVTWNPGDLNVIIGPNRAGKSNILSLLMLIKASANGRLEDTIRSEGGFDSIVWDGEHPYIDIQIINVVNKSDKDKDCPDCYQLRLNRLGKVGSYQINELLSKNEWLGKSDTDKPKEYFRRESNLMYSGLELFGNLDLEELLLKSETLLSFVKRPLVPNRYLSTYRHDLATIGVYNDINTSNYSQMRQSVITQYQTEIDSDGHNLVAVLHTLYSHDRDFKRAINEGMSAAFDGDFDELIFPPAADNRIQMRVQWKSLKRSCSSADMSDGTLRFLTLLTILESTKRSSVNTDPPSIVAIDEPELGLHPYLLSIIAEYAVEASRHAQVIFTTHSPQFLDAFEEDVPTVTCVNIENGETILKTLKGETLSRWLEDYSLGTLFKNGDLDAIE
ncbi:MAG: AAA family ATPase [Nitrospirae bacterium]|nr:AAA family ATPase [Nitrospirota bacterium]